MAKFRLTEIVNGAVEIVSNVGKGVANKVTKGAEAANDVGKTVVNTVDKTTKPAREFASKAGDVAVEGVRKGGQFYLKNRERVDAAMIAYPVGQTIAGSAIARGISAKLLAMVGLSASAGVASIAVPILFAVAAAYFGKDIVRKAEDFLKQGDTIQKAKKGDASAIKTIADTIATVVVQEKSEADAKAAIEDESHEKQAKDAVDEVAKEKANEAAAAANDDRPPFPDESTPS